MIDSIICGVIEKNPLQKTHLLQKKCEVNTSEI